MGFPFASIWCLPQENRGKNRKKPASRVRLLSLWQNQDEGTSFGVVALWFPHGMVVCGAWTLSTILANTSKSAGRRLKELRGCLPGSLRRRGTLNLRVVSSNPTLGVEPT
ncbi:unnamed protein product [Gulo gulo]|uniref:Uncharacterized protein n=1 Tax=Gulo gulo TaxID=48420 RepID=A0A9X9Q665_GULGU|nr:unnamed protein product [Gulo gulo]